MPSSDESLFEIPSGDEDQLELTEFSTSNFFEDNNPANVSYTNGFHSIHRLGELGNRQGGNNLKKAFEARTGGTNRKTLSTRTSHNKDGLLEAHANLIVSKMEQDSTLMEDSPDAEELRRTALRDMPQSLTIKRCVKVKLSKSVSQKSKRKPLSCWKTFKYRLSMGFEKLKLDLRDVAYSFELWYEPLKKIEGNFGTGVASFFKLLRWLFLVNLAIAVVAICFIVLPKVTYEALETPSESFRFVDLLTGEGYFRDTPLFYGFYTNNSINSVSALPYSMSHAYFFTILSVYLVSFVVFGISAATSYKKSFIETEGGLKNVFANKIFCGWDYNVATKDAAALKSKAIFNELKELLSDFQMNKRKVSYREKAYTALVQIFMNILIIFVMTSMAYVIWYFLNNISVDRDTRIIVTPIFINAIVTLLPMFFSFVVRYEDYKDPKVSLYLTLARTFVLGGVTIGVVVIYWVRNISDSVCWETSLGQEMYRLIIFDFLVSVVFVALIDVCLFGIYRLRTNINLEFDIAWNTMQIIYNQTLFWAGFVFSPILPVVLVVKLFLTWYIRQCLVLYLCKPSARSWRAAQTTTWFLVMTFLSLLLTGAVVGYIVSYIPVSNECGPFRNYQYVYEIVTVGVLQLRSNSSVWTIVLYITKPGVIAFILIAMCARVYYLRASARAQTEIVEQCRDMLSKSAEDKEYVYSLISQVTGGKWQYELYDKTVNPQLYTLNNSNDEHVQEIGRCEFYSSTLNNENGDLGTGPSSSNHFLNPSSSSVAFDPSFSSTTSFNEYSRYKKYT